MTEDERSIDHLEVMLENANLALSFVEGLDFAAFKADNKTPYAVAMTIVAIGEMSSRILQRNPELAERHPEVPWHQITGMRNRIAHDYNSIDLAVVWKIIQDSLPDLALRIPTILKPLLDKFDPLRSTRTPKS